jgi:hypothetical protein
MGWERHCGAVRTADGNTAGLLAEHSARRVQQVHLGPRLTGEGEPHYYLKT